MLIPLSWLKNYIRWSITVDELAHRLTMSGTEIGEIKRIGADWEDDKILIGQIHTVEEHPNADRLNLPSVSLGDGEIITVVCGAPNISPGQKIAFAKEGATLINARSGEKETLTKTKIRGILSTGMICSKRELGLGEDHEGILVLNENAPIGVPLRDYLGDTVLDAEITPNRPDCLSILGIAHEVAALTGSEVLEPDSDYIECDKTIEEGVTVKIANPELCDRYTASLITGITVGPSPEWLQESLLKMGQRSINNIVDITNYVMLEYGQPLHAFDFSKIHEQTIIVRTARPGETLLTLDSEHIKLDPTMIVVADSKNATALAGVIGGSESAVTENTTSVLLESANFDPVNIRRTTTALRLSTEASYRFERGIRADLAPLALKRATKLVVDLAGGKATKGIIDKYPGQVDPPVVKITQKRIKQMLGVSFRMNQIEAVLISLGCLPVMKTERELSVIAPYWRSDISIEEDLVEELARIVGYDAIPTTMLSSPVPHHKPDQTRNLRENIKDILVASGMQEIVSYPLTDLASLEAVEAERSNTPPIKIANPMSSEKQYMRTSLRASVLEVLSANRRASQGADLRLFEIGRVFLSKDQSDEMDLPNEKEMLVGVLSGPRSPLSWVKVPDQGDMDFFDAKGVLESIFSQIDISVDFQPSKDLALHPGKTASLVCEDTKVGVIGEVHPDLLERFDLGGAPMDTAQGTAPVAMFEVDLQLLDSSLPRKTEKYSKISRFPDSERDIALIVDSSVPSIAIQSIIQNNGLVRLSTLFDLYTGDGVPTGKKSITYRIVFRSKQGTLTSDEVDRAQSSIVNQLQLELGAELRQ